MRKTYAWYVREGMTPPAHLKPKVRGYKHNKNRADFMISVPSFQPLTIAQVVSNESVADIQKRIQSRFGALTALTKAVIDGHIKTLIVSGPAGLGKSYTVEEELAKLGDEGITWQINKGNAKATGLYRAFWKFREEGQIVVFDDCDAIFSDEVALNLLKAACDTSKTRRVSWLTETEFTDEDGETIPRSFEFNGSVIFITNYDFDAMVEKGTRLAPHMKALMSRSHYLDLMLKTAQDAMVRIRQVVYDTDILDMLPAYAKNEVLDFIEKHASQLREELSLRTVLKVAACRKVSHNWQEMARLTQCKS